MGRADSIPGPSAERAGIIVSFMLRAGPGHPGCSSTVQDKYRKSSGLRRERTRPDQDINFASRNTGPDFPPFG